MFPLSSSQASFFIPFSSRIKDNPKEKKGNMSFYPPGWDYERVINCAYEDFGTLTEEQHTTMLNGLKEAGLYQAFEDKIQAKVMESQAAARLAEEATKTEEQKLADRESWAPYIDTLKNVFKFEPEWSEWGFVVFRATAYGTEDNAKWSEFRRRWDQIIEEEHADQRGFHPKSDRAIELLRFRWVEDPSLEGASAVEVSRYVFHSIHSILCSNGTGASTRCCGTFPLDSPRRPASW